MAFLGEEKTIMFKSPKACYSVNRGHVSSHFLSQSITYMERVRQPHTEVWTWTWEPECLGSDPSSP